MPEPTIRAVVGPLDEDGLRDVGRLYGAVEPKYADIDFLRNLLCAGPAGPALHVFADAGGAAVGHCCVVPQPARRGGETLLAGKVEAFAVTERLREAAVAGRPVAIAVLERLYRLSDEHGIDVLHAYATRELGVLHRLLGFRAVDVGEPTLVGVFPRRGHRASVVALAVAQAAVRAPLRPRFTIRPPTDADADLVETPVPETAWTVRGEALWEWHRASGLLRVVEARGFRALIQAGAPGGGLQVLAWRPARPGVRSGLAALVACAQVANREREPALRYQPWGHDGGLGRAGRLLGLVPRRELNTLYVRSRRPELTVPEGIALTPFFYATF